MMMVNERDRTMMRGWLSFVPWLACWLLAAPIATAQVRYPPRIADREFVLDEANLISQEDRQSIVAAATRALDEHRVPIIVVTIPSMDVYGAGGWSIERYAMNLFSEWGIGQKPESFGVLLLVSKGDRKARIELGTGFDHGRDIQCRQIMDQVILPQFKSGNFSQGLRDGVLAIDEIIVRQASAAPDVANAAAPFPSDARAPPISLTPEEVRRGDGHSSYVFPFMGSALSSCCVFLVFPIGFLISIIGRLLGFDVGGSRYNRNGHYWGTGMNSSGPYGRSSWGGFSSRGSSPSSFGSSTGAGSSSSFGGGSSGGGGATGSW
jgi:uncharacterized membrane protein YgcG